VLILQDESGLLEENFLFGRVKLEALVSHVTEVKLKSTNCSWESNLAGHRGERHMH
jgi:hypothetical protein